MISTVLLSVGFCFASPTRADGPKNLGNTGNFSIRIDGSAANEALGDKFLKADFNQDGYDELIVSAYQADTQGRTDNGATYIIPGTLLRGLSGTGNIIDLAVASNYIVRFDGGANNDQLGSRGGSAVGDVDNDGKPDLLVGARNADFNSRGNSGSLYVIKVSQIAAYIGTGNTVDLATTSNFFLRYDGQASSDFLGDPVGGSVFDLNRDGTTDLLIPAWTADNNNRSASGSVYIILGVPRPVVAETFRAPLVSTFSAPDVIAGAGGTIRGDKVIAIVPSGALPWDAYLFTKEMIQTEAFKLKNSHYWQISSQYELWYKAFANDAQIYPVSQNTSSILALQYITPLPYKMLEKHLKIAYSADNGKTWKVLSNSVVDPTNRTVSVITKFGGRYMLVSRP